MDPQTQAQLQRVRKFSRNARAFCVLLFVCLALMSLWGLSNVLGTPQTTNFVADLGPYTISARQFTNWGVRVWVFVNYAAVYTILFAGLVHLFRLFGNFMAGGIYTKDNVRHIRHLGLLALGLSVLRIIMPLASMALLQSGFVDSALVTQKTVYSTATPYGIAGPELPSFITAAVLLLSSWIMDVGRQTKDEAEELRREADLVV